MKKNCWLVLSVLIAASATAQTSTNALPPIPAPILSPGVEAAPAQPAPKTSSPRASEKKSAPRERHRAESKSHSTKKTARHESEKISLIEPTVSLIPGPAEVAAKNLNVRGQAGLKGEFITHVTEGETVNVLGQITLDKPKAGEPAQWAKISLPTNAAVWVNAQFIDANNKTVSARKLNLRAGPSENYSVLGVIERGEPVSEITTRGNWTQIEPPTNAYAFVAAMYLKQEASGSMATNLPPSSETENTPMTTNTVSEPPTLMNETPTNLPATETNSTSQINSEFSTPPPNNLAQENSSSPTVTNILVVVETNLPPPPPRVVTHEGVVRPSVSLVAPTGFELYDPQSDRAIDYLYTTTTNLNVGRYDGFRIVVTGTEGMDARWKDTPLLTIQRIYVVSVNGKNSRGRNTH